MGKGGLGGSENHLIPHPCFAICKLILGVGRVWKGRVGGTLIVRLLHMECQTKIKHLAHTQWPKYRPKVTRHSRDMVPGSP